MGKCYEFKVICENYNLNLLFKDLIKKKNDLIEIK